MKKILAVALIALIAVAAVFADGEPTQGTAASSVVGPTNAYIKYQVTGLFDPKYTLTASDMDSNFVADAGSNKDVMAAGSVVFTIVDKSNFNDASTRMMHITFSVGNFILQDNQVSVASPTDEQTNAITTSVLAVAEGADSEAKTTTTVKNDLKLTIEYKAGEIVNRTQAGKDVATLTLTWAEKRVQAGTYKAIITIASEAV